MKTRDRRKSPSAPSVHRAERIPNEMLAPYMDTAVMSLGQALDGWRFHGGPRTEVDKALDALNALWQEVERRGL
jgi:hypothetical protein